MEYIDVYFHNIDKPITLSFSSIAAKDVAFENMSRKINAGSNWSNDKYFVKSTEVRFIHKL